MTSGVSTTIATQLAAVLSEAVEAYHLLNPKPGDEIAYPYATFEFSYRPSDTLDGGASYDVELDVDLFDRGQNTLSLLATEDAVVGAFERLRKISPEAFSKAKLEQALDVPTLVDELFRRQVQITVTMTLREKS